MKFLFVLIFIFSSISSALATNLECSNLFAPDQQVLRSQLHMTYSYLNLSFPQHPQTIRAGLTAFYFKNYETIETKTLFEPFSDEEWDELHQSMVRTHKHHNIEREVDLFELKRVTGTFIPDVTRTSIGALNVLLKPQDKVRVPRIYMDWESIVSNPKYEAELQKLKAYSEVILNTIKSPRARDLAERFRDSLNPELRLKMDPSEIVTTFQVASGMEALTVEALIIKFPELAEKTSKMGDETYTPPKTMAYFVYHSFVIRASFN